MVTAWTFLALMTGAMLLVGFQEASFALIERALTWWDPAWAAADTDADPAPDTAQEQTSDGLHFTDEDFMPYVLTAWGIGALVGQALGALRAALFGHRKRRPLRRQLWLAAAVGLGFAVVLLLCYLFGQAPYQGPAVFWFALFAGAPLMAWLVSAYSLSVNALLLRFKDMLQDDGPG
jgi:MFS family permease